MIPGAAPGFPLDEIGRLVADIEHLDARGIWHWQIEGLVGQGSDQIFVRDPFDNLIELHQVGTYRCNKAAL